MRELAVLDPGEGTQRQMLHAGVSAGQITRICLTHVHGDHCFGLPGVLSRLWVDQVEHPVHLHYPASGDEAVRHLRCRGGPLDRPSAPPARLCRGDRGRPLRPAAATPHRDLRVPARGAGRAHDAARAAGRGGDRGHRRRAAAA